MYTKDLVNVLSNVQNANKLDVRLEDGEVNFEETEAESGLFAICTTTEGNTINAAQLLFYMKNESENSCWGDSPYYEGDDANDIDHFSDCEVYICNENNDYLLVESIRIEDNALILVTE